MANVTAVVVTFNRPKELQMVVEALLNQSVVPTSILVVDNAGPNPAQNVLAPHPILSISRLSQNTGGAGGFAHGINEALKGKADWIWLMDDDAIPRKNALKSLLDEVSVSDDKTGALCGSVYEYGDIALAHRRKINYLFGFEHQLPKSAYQSVVEIQTGSFVGFFARATAAREVGLPDVDYFLAYDDTEYSMRLQKHGWHLKLVPGSEIDHLRPQGSRLRHGEFTLKHFYNVRNRIATMRKYCVWTTVASAWATLIGLVIWFRSEKCFSEASRRLFVKALLDGWAGRLGKI